MSATPPATWVAEAGRRATRHYRLNVDDAPFAKAFGRELAALRERTGLSQSRFAERVDVDHSYVSRVETGTRRPSAAMIHRIADTFGLDLAERNHLLATAFGVDLRPAELRDPDTAALVALLSDDRLPDALRLQVRTTLRTLVDLWTQIAAWAGESRDDQPGGINGPARK